MVGQVSQLIEKNYVMEMKKKDAEFMALQAQINPHFLFNSLEIINSLIEVEKYDTACEVNARLSALLLFTASTVIYFNSLTRMPAAQIVWIIIPSLTFPC